ncbi:MAK10-like protein [Tanacetum coccineum]
MGDENHILTLRDYSKPNHEGYRNTIELPVGNNVVPLRSDTIQLVQNGCSFNGHRSKDPNQHLKDFLKLVDSLDLDGANRERTRLRLFQFSLRDQASNWLERLPTGSITTWMDLTTRFLAQFFPLGRTAKLRIIRKARLYDNESWNDPRDFAKPVKEIALPQDVPSTSDRRLIELENQVQCLMKAHLAPTQRTQVNKFTTSCEICNGPHNTQYCMEDPEQAFIEYASSRANEAGGFNSQSNLEGLVSNFMASQDARLSKFEADFKQQQNEITNKIDIVLKAITDQIAGALPSDMQQSDSHDDRIEENKEEEKVSPENIDVNPSMPPDLSVSFITKKVLKLNLFFESLGLVPQSSSTKLVCTKGDDSDVMFIEIFKKYDDSHKEEPKAGEHEVEYFDIFLTRSELAYHKYLMCGPIPSIFLRNSIIMEGCPSNLKIPCNIGHVHVEKVYIDPNSPLNIMTRMMYNWIMRRKLDPRENMNRGVNNFIGRINGMHVFVGNFTYIVDFMIVEDISSIIDSRLSQVVLGKPFMEISNMTYDPSEGVVRFINRTGL